MKVQDRIIAVTGAGSGIARELSHCLTSRGATVAELKERMLARFDAVDGIVNNAGIIQPFLNARVASGALNREPAAPTRCLTHWHRIAV